MGFTIMGELNKKWARETFETNMYQGKIIKDQCDRIRKMKDNAVNEDVVRFIKDIEIYLHASREPEIVSLLCKLDLATLDKGRKVDTKILKDNPLVECYSFSTVDAYTIRFKCWWLNININRRSSTVTKIG